MCPRCVDLECWFCCKFLKPEFEIWKKYKRPGRDIRSVLYQTEFRTRVEGVTVPHTRPDCTIFGFHLEATKGLYTTRAHVTQLFVEPIKMFCFFLSFGLSYTHICVLARG
jgi:hypothetical protein